MKRRQHYRVASVQQLLDGGLLAGDIHDVSTFCRGATRLTHALYSDPTLAPQVGVLMDHLLKGGLYRAWFAERMDAIEKAFDEDARALWTKWPLPLPPPRNEKTSTPRTLTREQRIVMLARAYTAVSLETDASRAYVADLLALTGVSPETAYWQWVFRTRKMSRDHRLADLAALAAQPTLH